MKSNFYVKTHLKVYLILLVALFLFYGCSKSTTIFAKKQLRSKSDSGIAKQYFKTTNTYTHHKKKIAKENCTVHQHSTADEVETERFFCKVEDDKLLRVYVKPKENYIAWMDSSKEVYVLNHSKVNAKFVVNGSVVVNNNSWEFIPQKKRFLVGPKRVQIILD